MTEGGKNSVCKNFGVIGAHFETCVSTSMDPVSRVQAQADKELAKLWLAKEKEFTSTFYLGVCVCVFLHLYRAHSKRSPQLLFAPLYRARQGRQGYSTIFAIGSN
jgi:hypothetical protein